MKYLIAILFFMTPFMSQADLLDRLKLEDTVRNRVEETLRTADRNARAVVRFEFKKFNGDLPGTPISQNYDLLPNKIETADISKVNVIAFTELEDFPKEIQDTVYSAIPFDKAKIDLTIKKYPIVIKPLPRIDSRDISEIAEKTVKTFSLVFGICIFLTVSMIMGFLFLQNNKKMTIFRDQLKGLATSFSEGSGGGGSRAPMPTAQENSARFPTESPSEESKSILHHMSSTSLVELMADCYWTEQDQYANWIWKNLETSQQADLYVKFDKMREYALYFVNTHPVQMVFHDHPYYLQPNQLMKTSQEDLMSEMKSNLDRWHLISPIRQEFLPLDLKAKLKAVQTNAPTQAWSPSKTSSPRKLKSTVRWGRVSLQDEKTIFENPNMVPDQFKASIPSLVWLARKEPAQIAQILNQFDARSLAEAWVGPEEVLEKLEQALPEKKLKLLQTYRSKTDSSRASPVYAALVQQGLKDEAA